jgi:hypothetical protein
MAYEVTAPEEPVRFFRLLTLSVAVPAEFLSHHELGIPRREPIEDAAVHRGISVFRTRAQAEGRARGLQQHRHRLGLQPFSHVAEIELTGDRGHVFARWGGRGHHTVWGEADQLAAQVMAVSPLSRGAKDGTI